MHSGVVLCCVVGIQSYLHVVPDGNIQLLLDGLGFSFLIAKKGKIDNVKCLYIIIVIAEHLPQNLL